MTSRAFCILVLLLSAGCSRQRVESLNHMNNGVQLAAQRQYLQAVEELQRAGSIDPTNDNAYWNLAIVHMEMQRYDAAKEDLRHAIQIAPNSAGYHEKLGTVLMELQEWDAAKTAFETAIEKDPNLFKAYFKLAQILERQDDPQHALQRYTEAITKGPRFIPGYRSLGRLYADLGYLTEAVQVLRSGLQVCVQGTVDEAELHHILGTVYQQQQNYDGAVAEFRAALDIDNTMRDALFSLGWTYSLQDNRSEATRFLRRFLEVAGRDCPPHYKKAAEDRLVQLGGP